MITRYALVTGWLRVLRRRWPAGATLFALVAISGTAMVLLARPVYRAESRLRLGEPPPMSGVSPTAGFFGLLRMGGDPFANDLELLASRTLAERVVDDAVLHVRVNAPRGWHRDSILHSLHADRSTVRAAYTVTWSGDNVAVASPKHPTVRGSPGTEIVFGGVRAVFLPWRPGMPREVKVATVPHAQAARELSGQLVIDRTRRDANVIRVRFQGTDPGVTQNVAAATVTRFTELRTRLMQRESGETVDSLRSVGVRVRSELALSEAALEDMQRSSGLIAPEAQAEANVERFSDVLVRLETARVELSALDQALARSNAATDAATSWAALLSYPRFLANATMGELMTLLFELEQQRRELSRRRTETNVELRAVLDQIAHLDQSLRSVATDFAITLRSEVGALERQTSSMQRELAAVPAAAIELGRRHRELRVLTEMVVVTEQRLRQEELRQALTFANVQVIDPPALYDRPIWPRRKLGPAVAVLIAGFTALAGMVVVERADHALRSAAQVRAALGASVIASVRTDAQPPFMPEPDAAALLRRAERARATRMCIADVEGGRAGAAVAAALRAHMAVHEHAGVCVEVLPPVDGFGVAAAAAATGTGVVVAVEIGVATDAAVSRSAALLREAGATVDGAVLVCRDAASLAEAWSS
jgi:uncharacterized protein involved in exopolysaccharide biosynthesis